MKPLGRACLNFLCYWRRPKPPRFGRKYRVSDTYPDGYDAIWDRTVSKKLEFHADAQGSAVAA